MSEDEQEMSDEELDALLSDLESRSEQAGSSGSASSGGDLPEGEDLESFLQQVEQEAAESTGGEELETAVAERSEGEEGPDLSEFEDLEDELPVESASDEPVEVDASDSSSEGEGAAEKRTEGAAETSSDTSEKSAAGGESKTPYLRYAWVASKWTGFTLPVLAFWWLLGAYLGQWVSAGWLILAVTTIVVFGLPKLAHHYAKERGHYRWWLAGISLVLTVGLVAPLTGQASRALSGYGHWPGEAVVEITGVGEGMSAAAGALGGMLGRTLDPTLSEEAVGVELGSAPEPAEPPTGEAGEGGSSSE